MAYLVVVLLAMSTLVACGGDPAASSSAAAPPGHAGGEENEFVLRDSDRAARGRGESPSRIEATRTEAAVRFIVVDRDDGPLRGIVISLTAPDGTRYYTGETDAKGYAEVLVPVGRKYDLVYLSLGRREVSAQVEVSGEPKQNITLTLRYKRHEPPKAEPGAAPVAAPAAAPRFVLDGIYFDTGQAALREASFARLDSVVEYMTHRRSARIEISGHTDNVGDPRLNKRLSEQRAQACRDYLIEKGIDGSRIVAVGYGDERPAASNDTEQDRQKNRRIEATEL
jgi:outer membrane protein OmpA-like peptidoglycan-associated protein